MKKYFLILFSAVLFISGCATTSHMKGTSASGVAYTDAPINIAFDISCQALQSLGYIIELKDQDNYFVKGKYSNPLVSYTGIYGQVETITEAGGTKIVYGIYEPGGIAALDITFSYPRYANNIFIKIEEQLKSKGYKVQKSR